MHAHSVIPTLEWIYIEKDEDGYVADWHVVSTLSESVQDEDVVVLPRWTLTNIFVPGEKVKNENKAVFVGKILISEDIDVGDVEIVSARRIHSISRETKTSS